MAKRVRACIEFSDSGAHSIQEDRVFIHSDRDIYVVADGFGGPVSGRQAADLAVAGVREFLEREAGDLEATLPFVLRSYYSLAGNVIFNALVHANRKVSDFNTKRNIHDKGGASAISLFMHGSVVALGNVGSCGAWLVRDGKVVRLVLPRNYARLVDPFTVDESPAFSAPLVALGTGTDVEPEIVEYQVRKGDWLLMATDGVPERWAAQLGPLQLSSDGDVSKMTRELERILANTRWQENASGALLVV